MEAKLDAILMSVESAKAEDILKGIDEEFAGRHTDQRYMRLLAQKAKK
jgi:hypothetical protein